MDIGSVAPCVTQPAICGIKNGQHILVSPYANQVGCHVWLMVGGWGEKIPNESQSQSHAMIPLKHRCMWTRELSQTVVCISMYRLPTVMRRRWTVELLTCVESSGDILPNYLNQTSIHALCNLAQIHLSDLSDFACKFCGLIWAICWFSTIACRYRCIPWPLRPQPQELEWGAKFNLDRYRGILVWIQG